MKMNSKFQTQKEVPTNKKVNRLCKYKTQGVMPVLNCRIHLHHGQLDMRAHISFLLALSNTVCVCVGVSLLVCCGR